MRWLRLVMVCVRVLRRVTLGAVRAWLSASGRLSFLFMIWR